MAVKSGTDVVSQHAAESHDDQVESRGEQDSFQNVSVTHRLGLGAHENGHHHGSGCIKDEPTDVEPNKQSFFVGPDAGRKNGTEQQPQHGADEYDDDVEQGYGGVHGGVGWVVMLLARSSGEVGDELLHNPAQEGHAADGEEVEERCRNGRSEHLTQGGRSPEGSQNNAAPQPDGGRNERKARHAQPELQALSFLAQEHWQQGTNKEPYPGKIEDGKDKG